MAEGRVGERNDRAGGTCEPETMIAMPAEKVVWEDREFTEVRPGILGTTVHTPQLTATLYRYGAGTSWEEHQHPQDQVTTVLEGAIDFVVAGEPLHLTRGQTATLPGGTPHSASVPETGRCVTINVLTSRREPPSAG
jgi:quercetin dioxygenase-like cupin family protein